VDDGRESKSRTELKKLYLNGLEWEQGISGALYLMIGWVVVEYCMYASTTAVR